MGAFAVFGAMAMTSCKKDYVCTYKVGTTTMTQDYPDLNKADKEAAESACKLIGGTLSAK